jgi:hypothetical protein
MAMEIHLEMVRAEFNDNRRKPRRQSTGLRI